jgi:hypothetical protein
MRTGWKIVIGVAVVAAITGGVLLYLHARKLKFGSADSNQALENMQMY